MSWIVCVEFRLDPPPTPPTQNVPLGSKVGRSVEVVSRCFASQKANTRVFLFTHRAFKFINIYPFTYQLLKQLTYQQHTTQTTPNHYSNYSMINCYYLCISVLSPGKSPGAQKDGEKEDGGRTKEHRILRRGGPGSLHPIYWDSLAPAEQAH